MKKLAKPRNYTQLTQSKRDRMEILLKEGMFQYKIASVLKVHPSTISRERKRKKNNGVYDADVAQAKANVKRSNSKYQGMKIVKDNVLRKRIIVELKANRSPDEIAGMLTKEGMKIGKDAIYKWLYTVHGQNYTKYLCTRRKKKKSYVKKTKRALIPNRISIEFRPESGLHAEGDTLLSPKKAQTTECASMVVLQKTKLMSGHRLPNLKPETMLKSLKEISDSVPFDDITLDNGIENRLHEQLTIPSYFCTPHSPWEKPLVEQSIGLLRRWCLPKGTDLSSITDAEYQDMLNFLNHKKRKSLGYKSAYEYSLECGIISALPAKTVAVQYRI